MTSITPLTHRIVFPHSGSVVGVSVTKSPSGQPIKSYTVIPALSGLRYRMAPLILHRPTDVEEAQMRLSERTILRFVIFPAYYSQINESMEFLDKDGIYWDITSHQSDGNQIYSRLRVQRVLP